MNDLEGLAGICKKTEYIKAMENEWYEADWI